MFRGDALYRSNIFGELISEYFVFRSIDFRNLKIVKVIFIIYDLTQSQLAEKNMDGLNDDFIEDKDRENFTENGNKDYNRNAVISDENFYEQSSRQEDSDNKLK